MTVPGENIGENAAESGQTSAHSWGEGVGRILHLARNGRPFMSALDDLRRQIVPLIAAATMEKVAY